QPPLDMAEFGSTAPQQRHHRTGPLRRAQKMGDGVAALRKGISTDSGTVVDRLAFTGVGVWLVHAGAEVRVDPPLPVLTLHDCGGRVRPDPGGGGGVVLCERFSARRFWSDVEALAEHDP